MPFGAELLPTAACAFASGRRRSARCRCVLAGSDEAMPDARPADGWFELTTAAAGAGSRYRFQLDDGLAVPDPASRSQPDDVHGPSVVVDPAAYDWRHADWRGRPWHETVLYELHVGTFTRGGHLRGVRRKLDHLAELGVTAIELMPLADFPGARNWGYDGVLPFAPDAAYGTPEDLKALVDEAHGARADGVPRRRLQSLRAGGELPARLRAGLLHRERPHALGRRDRLRTAPRCATSSIHNALYWLEEYRFDGLRLDAVHAIIDHSETHILDELAPRRAAARRGRAARPPGAGERRQRARACSSATGRQAGSTTRSGTTTSTTSATSPADRRGAAATTRDYAERRRRSAGARARRRASSTRASPRLPRRRAARRAERRICRRPRSSHFLQNHDQIGNRAFGERLADLAPRRRDRGDARRCCCWRRTCRCCSWARNGARPQPFCSSPTSTTSWRMPCARAGGGSSRSFPQFADEPARAAIPDPNAAGDLRRLARSTGGAQDREHADWLRLVRASCCACAATRSCRAAARRSRSGGTAEVAGSRAAGRDGRCGRRPPDAARQPGAPESGTEVPPARRHAAVRSEPDLPAHDPARAACRPGRCSGCSPAKRGAEIAAMAPLPSRARPTGCSSTPASASRCAALVPYLAALGVSHLTPRR